MAHQREVEEAGEIVHPGRLDREHVGHDLVGRRRHGGEEVGGALAFPAVAELDEREHLARHVAALTPAGQLSVGKVGQLGGEGG